MYHIREVVMLYKYFKEDNRFINIFNKIIDSKIFMFLIVLLGLLSNLFAIELLVYTIYAVIVVMVALFGRNFIANLPMAVVGYMTFSKYNNPRGPDQTSIFLERDTIIKFIIICVIIGSFALARIVHDFIYYKERRKFPKLALGFIILGFSFFHGGAYTEGYEFKTSIFGLVEILSLSFTYLVFYYTSDFSKINKEYWAELFTMVSMLMFVEIGYMLFEVDAFDFSKEFSRGELWTGWGNHNNVGGVAIMCLPAPFYLATVKKHGWFYCFLGNLAMLSIGLSMSRNSMLFGFVTYFIILIIVAIISKGRNRVANLSIYFCCLVATALTITFGFDEIRNLFSSVLDKGTDDNGRIEIYIDAFNQFKTAPVFGLGFYECGAFQWGIYDPDSFLPGRYHNSIFQLLASTGVFGLLAYGYHRFETIKLLFKNFNYSKLFIWLCLFVFLVSSLFDCFFFNFGPGLIYSALLLFLEKQQDDKVESV